MNEEDIKPNIPFWIEELLEMKERIVNDAKDKTGSALKHQDSH